MMALPNFDNSKDKEKMEEAIKVLRKYLTDDIIEEMIPALMSKDLTRIILAIELARVKTLNSQLRSLKAKEQHISRKGRPQIVPTVEYIKVLEEVEVIFNKIYQELDKIYPGLIQRYEELTL